MRYYQQLLFVVSFALLTVGGGCRAFGDSVTDAALQPVTVPLAGLEQAQTVSAAAQAAANWQAASVANELIVALILSDGAINSGAAEIGATIGCNDQLAFIAVPREVDSGNPLTDSLTSLFALRESTWRGYYNSLAFSSLAVESVSSPDGAMTEVRLKGELQSAGTCDDPRIKHQVEDTIRRLQPNFRILLNGTEAAWRCFGDQSGNCQ